MISGYPILAIRIPGFRSLPTVSVCVFERAILEILQRCLGLNGWLDHRSIIRPSIAKITCLDRWNVSQETPDLLPGRRPYYQIILNIVWNGFELRRIGREGTSVEIPIVERGKILRTA
jgi:hypothetical protein